MAIYSRSEFADVCGVHASYITNYVNRSKIFVNSENKIDTSNRDNAEFLAKMSEKKRLKELVESSEVSAISINKKNKVVSKTLPKQDSIKQELEEKEKEYLSEKHKLKHDLDIKQAAANLEKKEIDIRLALLTEAKLKGENLPTEEIKMMIRELSVQFITNYKDSFEKMIIEFSHRNKISVDEEARIKNDFINILNQTHKKVFEDVKTSLSRIEKNAKSINVSVKNSD